MFSERLRSLRKARGLTQRQLADIIGISQAAIGKYEGTGFTLPSFDVQRRLAEYFGVSIDFLMGATETPHSDMPLDDKSAQLLQFVARLNSDGMDMLLSYAHMLLGMPKYAKDAPTSAAI